MHWPILNRLVAGLARKRKSAGTGKDDAADETDSKQEGNPEEQKKKADELWKSFLADVKPAASASNQSKYSTPQSTLAASKTPETSQHSKGTNDNKPAASKEASKFKDFFGSSLTETVPKIPEPKSPEKEETALGSGKPSQPEKK